MTSECYPMSEVRGGGREEQPQVQGAAAARSQEGQEELLHMKGKGNPPSPATPSPETLQSPRSSDPEGDALGMTTLHGGTEPVPSFSTQSLLH
ncbi:hypothetical protein R6Z07F_005186 [Ovis aries]